MCMHTNCQWMQLFILSHATADRHPRPDTRDGLCPVGDTAAGEHLESRARACACHLPKAPFPSAPSTPSWPRESLGDARPGSLTDASSCCRTSPTARCPWCSMERFAVLQNSFGPTLHTAYEQIVRAPNDGNGWSSSREPGPRENRWAERDLPGSANGFSARFFLVSVGTSDLVSFSHAGTSDVGAVRTRKRFPIPSG